MARQRMIRPEIWESRQVKALTDFEFRVYIGTISHGDDEGRLSASPIGLSSKIFPLSGDIELPEKIRNAVQVIESMRDGKNGAPLIGVYQVGDEVFIFHPNWKKHQIIAPSRVVKSKLPPPPPSKEYIKRRNLVIGYGYKLLSTVDAS